MKITLKHGDVLLRTSLFRRMWKREEWAVVERSGDLLFIRGVKDGKALGRFGDMDVINDPRRWPDEVCAAVARLKLSE